MNKYELALIFSPSLEDADFEAECEKVLGIIARFGGEVEKADVWGRRRLAYEINKVNEGIYYFLNMTADASAPAEIEARLRIMESVIRYLIIRLDD